MDISPPYPRSSTESDPNIKRRAVLAMTGRQVRIYDLTKLREKIEARSDPGVEPEGEAQWEAEQNRESSLKYMIRDLRCNPNGVGECLSNLERKQMRV